MGGMKMTKRLVSLLLVLIMVFSVTAPAYALDEEAFLPDEEADVMDVEPSAEPGETGAVETEPSAAPVEPDDTDTEPSAEPAETTENDAAPTPPVVVPPVAPPTGPQQTKGEGIYLNPLYEGIVSEDELYRRPETGVATYASVPYYSSISSAGVYVRQQMKARAATVDFSVPYTGDPYDVLDSIFGVAFQHTGVANEGDYIRFQYGGVYFYYSYNSSQITYQLDISYYTTLAQEQKVTSTLSTVLQSLNLTGKTDYQKAEIIYNYICSHVTYDYAHLNNSNYKLQFTAYAALVQGTAVCQGYANLFYRMALHAGIDNRIVTSYDHAWNIVRMGSLYYNVDSTWDSNYNGTRYYYFLLCDDTFTNDYSHVREFPYNSSSFYASYPMGSTDFVPTAADRGALPAPVLTSAVITSSGIQIKWNAVSGAAKYRIYYKTGSGSWTTLVDTTATSYTWGSAQGSTVYTFTVRTITSNGKAFTGAYDTTGLSVNYTLTTPKLDSVTSATNGVTVTWSPVANASKYRIFYKTGSGSWAKLVDTASTSYTWTGAKYGTAYTFTVRCLSPDAKSYLSAFDSTGLSITHYLSTPKLNSVTNTTNGVIVKWDAVSGAAKYRVFYKTGSGGWTKLVDTTATSYTWTGAKSGTTYSFTVRCINSAGTGYTSAHDTTGMSITYKPVTLDTPKLSSVTNTADGVSIRWDAVSGAVKYRIFYKTGTGGWTKLVDTTSTGYTWTGAKSGTTYTFTVRCINSAGTAYTSDFDTTGMSITYTASP